jgi:glutathione S-transferase
VHPTTKQIRDAVANSTDGLSEHQLRLHPEGKWDSAAILEHLALTFGTTASLFQKVLREGRPLATSPTLKHRVRQLGVLTFGYIPSGRKSPKRVEPTGISGREAQELIFANLEKMDLALAECERRFGNKLKIADHPVLGPIRLSGWRKFHLLHTRHHMKQIDALTATYAAVDRNVAAAS